MGRSRASTALRGDAASSQSARWMGQPGGEEARCGADDYYVLIAERRIIDC